MRPLAEVARGSLETVAADGYRFPMSDAPNIIFNSVSKGEVSATYEPAPRISDRIH